MPFLLATPSAGRAEGSLHFRYTSGRDRVRPARANKEKLTMIPIVRNLDRIEIDRSTPRVPGAYRSISKQRSPLTTSSEANIY